MKKVTETETTTTPPSGAALFARALKDRLEVGPGLHRLRQTQVWIALALASLALTWGGMKLGDRFGFLIGFFLAVGLNALVMFYDDWRLNSQFPGHDLEGRDPWNCLFMTRHLVRQLAAKSGRSFPMPTLREVPSETPFVFASGLTSKRLRISISTAAMHRLEADELGAVIGFQLMRFHTDQLRVTTAAAALSDLIFTLAGALDAAFFLRFFLRQQPRRSCPGPVTWLILPFVIAFLRLVIQRKSMLAIDHLTAETFGCGPALARALVKLDAYNKTLPSDVNCAEACLFTVDPLASLESSHWASVQPPIDERIRSLTGHYPM